MYHQGEHLWAELQNSEQKNVYKVLILTDILVLILRIPAWIIIFSSVFFFRKKNNRGIAIVTLSLVIRSLCRSNPKNLTFV